MKKLFASILILATVAISGCSETVPPAHRGKVLSADGYSEATYAPGRLWPVAPWNTVVFLDMSTNIKNVPYEVFMSDKLQLKGDVAIRAGLRDDDQNLVNKMFDDIKLDVQRGDTTLDFDRVWSVYAKDVVSNEIRNVLSKTNWDAISADYDKYGGLIRDRINTRLANTPVKVGDVNLGRITPPEAISKKYEEIEKKIMDLAKEDAEFEVENKKKSNAKELAIAQGKVDQQIADNAAAVNKTIANSITPQLLQMRNIEMLQTISPDANMVIVPYDALKTTGIQGKMYQQ